MSNILIRSGWLGRNDIFWYKNSGDLGDPIVALNTILEHRGHRVYFSGQTRPKEWVHEAEIHIERQLSLHSCPKVVVYCEPSFVQPQNILLPEPSYAQRFYIDSKRVLRDREVRYYYPRDWLEEDSPNWSDRDILVSAIAANKNSVIRSRYNLYPDRRDLIMEFGTRFRERFHLYGGGWELKDHPPGIVAKLFFRMSALRPMLRREPALSFYHGKCEEKGDVMQRSKFTLCVENTQYPGCMTEKMIDCFRFGSIPLYLGPPDIAEMIDPALFIDLRTINDLSSVFDLMESFTDKEYLTWRESLAKNKRAISERHSILGFASMIADAIDCALQEARAAT